MKSLALALFAVLLLPVLMNSADRPPVGGTKAKRIEMEEVDKWRADTNRVTILDVRSAAEFQAGHIPGAVNIDINQPAFAEKVNGLDKTKILVVNCAVGMRSKRACEKIEGMGFKGLYDFSAGFDGWKKARKPVEK